MLWLGDGGTAMPALRIREDISSGELRRQARRESEGRVSARLIAIANALDGMDRASAARLAGMDRQRLLWSLELSHRKTRPRHPQTDEKAQQAFKKGALPPA